MSADARLDGLPPNIVAVLSAFLDAAREALSDDLLSAILFGSAADGRLSPTSDVNLLLVLRRFAPERIARLRDGLLAAEAAIKLRVMLVLEDELPSAAELFAQKFADILRRHRTVLGKDLVGALQIPRSAEIFRLRQVLLNLVLRLREAYATRGHRPEQVAHLLAETVGPLRAACATLLELEGAPAADSSAALTSVAAAFGAQGAMAQAIAAHDGELVGGEDALFQLLALVRQISERAAQLT